MPNAQPTNLIRDHYHYYVDIENSMKGELIRWNEKKKWFSENKSRLDWNKTKKNPM